MKQGIGLFLVTLGAILRYAIDDNWDAADMSTIGLILMIVGAIAWLTDVLLEVGKRRQHVPASAPMAPPAAQPGVPPVPPPAPPPPKRD
ncbi:MAG: hypothetical protein KF830_12315 [Planctomycetes bacterium]|nr:hypothetical protein [Planctomycetota bacterium]